MDTKRSFIDKILRLAAVWVAVEDAVWPTARIATTDAWTTLSQTIDAIGGPDVDSSIKVSLQNAIKVAVRTAAAGANIETAAWNAVIRSDTSVTTSIVDMKFDPIAIVESLLHANFDIMPSNGRCYYLWSVWDIVDCMPDPGILSIQLQTLIVKYGYTAVFANIRTVTTADLEPLVIGVSGDDIVNIISDYAIRSPTREEAMSRMLAI